MTMRECFIELLNKYEARVVERELSGQCDLDKCDSCDLRGFCDNLRGKIKLAKS